MKTNLKNLRNSKGMSTTQMAEALGLSVRTYQNYENGSTEMNYALILKVADFFECSTDFLLCHQTKDLIYASELSKIQTKLIEKIKLMPSDKLLILEGVIMRLEEES